MRAATISFACVLGLGCGSPPDRVTPPPSSAPVDVKTAPRRAEWRWFTDVDAALAEARTSGRPTFVFVGAEWSAGAKELANHLEDPSIRALLAERYVGLRVDVTDDESAPVREIVERFQVKGVPTLLVLDASGKETERRVDLVTVDVLAELLRRAAPK